MILKCILCGYSAKPEECERDIEGKLICPCCEAVDSLGETE